MNNEHKKQFEHQFQAAISQTLRQVSATDDVRSRILHRLKQEPVPTLPVDLSEEKSQQFQDRLSEAVHRSQEQAPDDRLVLRIETALSRELQQDLLSERAVAALLGEEASVQPLVGFSLSQEKTAFIHSLRAEIARTTQKRITPIQTRTRVLQALTTAQRPASKIIPFPSRGQWARGLSALTSLAAGFAILFVTLFTSADVALANSVRADHVSCCRGASITQDSSAEEVQAILESEFGPVPVPPVDSSWVLRVSRICQTEEGKPMVHLLYMRANGENNSESMSMHFIPKKHYDINSTKLSGETVQPLSDDNFPVVAWTEGDWVCTACSPDLDMTSLRAQTDNQL